MFYFEPYYHSSFLTFKKKKNATRIRTSHNQLGERKDFKKNYGNFKKV